MGGAGAVASDVLFGARSLDVHAQSSSSYGEAVAEFFRECPYGLVIVRGLETLSPSDTYALHAVLEDEERSHPRATVLMTLAVPRQVATQTRPRQHAYVDTKGREVRLAPAEAKGIPHPCTFPRARRVDERRVSKCIDTGVVLDAGRVLGRVTCTLFALVMDHVSTLRIWLHGECDMARRASLASTCGTWNWDTPALLQDSAGSVSVPSSSLRNILLRTWTWLFHTRTSTMIPAIGRPP